ncbi:non-ribosomal peptide synthetase/type I polyketide synthase [Paenibacillus sonchi]|uniref:non-ribosomal peptide synthetase/type I polyketide synthase n=3 Tax=Paenibacillus sonchi TaxID=373687 RepID=UPI001F27ACEB|nr:non-ribosomal peptide synthetase/type I polyketide synthase [Paenibacillus sonchi]
MPDGRLQFVGRNDGQVKIRGHRIEIEGIESTIKSYPAVKDAVVIEVKEAGGAALAAYLVTGSGFDREDFQAFLKSKLPYYAVPANLYPIGEIPYTSNLKVDRKALAQMKTGRMVPSGKLVEPRSKLENEVAAIWKKVLKLESVGIFNRFFDIGGDSVKVIHLCNELKARLNMEIPVQTIFDYPTIHEFVSYCNDTMTRTAGEARQQPAESKAFQPPILDFQDTDVAIIGMAGRFPGAADKEQFWSNLVSGKEAIKFYTDEELKALGMDSELLNNPKYVRAKGKLDDSDCFDADFFGYTVAEAKWMDPQIRLLHECAWHALEDAGYEPESYPGAIGLYIGSSYNIYWVPEKFSPSLYASDQYQIYNMNSNSFATLIAYRMNLRGPAITVQTACSTSLVAIDRAYKDLLFGDCDIAVAGGAAVTLLDEMGYIHQEGMVLSKDGHCRAFEKKATGTVTGNGVGLVVLKRLKNALADGDHIYSIIKSTAVNNDGNRKAGYSAPSAEGQAAVIQKAIQRSGIGSEQIHYIEAHGTGTVLGDPVEIEGLKRAFNTSKKNYCGLGSVKTNIGHLEAAAGIAGLMKTSMSLQKRMIPASLNCDEINAHIVLEDSPFYVNTRLLDLRNEDNYPLRAGVSSFGQGGSNAHVILEEAPQVDSGPAHRRYVIMTLSAKTEPALNNLKGKVRESFRRSPGVHLADAAYTLKVGRKSFAHRSAFLCTETKEAIDILTAKETAKRWDAIVTEQAPSVVFMFSGQGAEYVNMALDLYRHEPVFRDKLNECLTILQEISGLRYQDFLFPDGREQQAERHIHRQSVSQPLHFALEYSLAWLLMNWQVEPLSMIGYSIGEYVAACLAGVFSLHDALFLTYHRGVLMEKLPEGLMITVPLQEADLLQILPPALSVAAVNDESCIVSGSKDSIAAFEALLKSKKLISMRLQISHAGHSKMLDSMISEFRECVQRVTCNPPAVPFVSSLTGDVITPEEAASPEHWVRHLREPVRFAEGFKKLAPQENTLFIEIGPGRNLCTLVQRFMQPDRKQKLLDTIRVERKKTADDEYLLRTVAQLWVNGVSVDWSRFYSNEQRRRVPLPGYPFEKKRYWLRDFRYGMGSPAVEAVAGQAPYDLPEAPAESEASPVQAEPKPMSSEAAILAQMVTDIIGGTTIGEDDDLFERGFDSLKVISFISKVTDAFRVQLTMHEVFQNPTIRELLPVIQRQAPGQAVAIPKAPEAACYPVSSQQKRLYALQQFDEDSTAYNIPGAFVLHGKLDRERVQAACDGLIRRHEALRTSFELSGQALVQKIDPHAALAIAYSDLPGAGVEETLQGFVQPFRLEQAPLIRIRLVRVENECHVLQIDMHHIISDGLSIELLIRDFLAYYEGRALEEPRIQYKDYAVWQQNRESAFWQEERAFWLEQYKDGYELLNLPTDFRRPPIKQFAGALRPFAWTEEISGSLQAFCQTHQITPYMLLLSCFTILLAKYSGQQEVLVGTPVGGRLGVDTEDTVGAFVNTLALRSRPDGTKVVLDYLQEVREYCLHAFDHQGYPFEELVQDIEKERDVSRNPLFDTMFAWEQRDRSQLHISGLQVQRYDFHSGIAKFDLMLQAWEEQGEMGFSIEYATALFKDSTIQRMGGHYQQIVRQVLQSPGRTIRELSLLGAEEAEQVQYGFNQTEAGYDLSQSIITLIEQQAEKRGGETAVVWEGQRLTYRELNERANQVARLLRDQGCQRDEIIGILAERSPAMIIGLLGIEKAGCAYLPLDPDYPAERIGYLIADSGLKTVLTQTAFASQATALGVTAVDVEEEAIYAGYERDNVALDILPHHLAYVLYTSGSTGKPKGVLLTHGGLVNRLRWMAEAYGMDEREVVLQKTTYTFDVSVWELFLPLMTGGVLCLAKPGGEKDPDYLVQLIRSQGITTLHFVPSMLSGFVHALPENASLGQLKRCICSGEELTLEVKERFFRRGEGVELHNLYGPTEATIDVSSYEVHPADPLIPIGKPVANTCLYIVSEEGGLVPVGIPGELCIGGVQLAKGYLNRPELTAEKFRTLPGLPEERLYFTGDLARWREDGNIEYLGRKDTQIKLRGYRIELGEIESAIQKYDSRIETAVVVSQGAQAETKVLCAYFTARERIETEALREYLRRELPSYMVPVFYAQLDALPHTSSGKADRKALAEAAVGHSSKEPVTEVISSKEGQMLENIFKETLGCGSISPSDSFFELGGNSLTAIVLKARIAEAFHIHVTILDIFANPTIRELLPVIRRQAPGQAVAIPKAPEAACYPVSSQQKRLYALQQFDEDSTAYNIPGAFVLHGKLDRERVQAACDGLIRRHEALRTSFELSGQALVQKIDPHAALAIAYSDLPGAGVEETLQGFVQPFRLEQAPLIRIGLVRVENECHVLQIDMHHIISDGLSIELLIRDFLAYYEGRALEEPRIQYKDYAVWQQNRESAFWQEERAFWLEQYKDGYELLNLPTDFRRPPIKQFAGALRPFAWTEEISGSLQAFCQTHQITPYMLLLSCFTILLAKYSGQQEVLVGTPVGGRLGVDTEDTVGAFVNTLALRSRPDGTKVVLDYLQEVREYCLHAFDHQGYPFEELVQDIEKERDVSRNPLFDTMFAWEQRDRSQLHISGLQVQRYDFHSGIAKFDLMLQAWEEQGEMGFSIEYATALFKDSTIQRMGGHYQQIVRQVLQSPGRTIRELSLLGAEEAEQVQYGFNRTEAGYDLSQSIITLIEQQAEKRGDETAVVWEGQRLTYRELNERANQVARLLRDRGCQRDEIIGILAERSPAMIIGLLGIEKAGCAYLPLDPDYPAERIGYLIQDSGLKLVLTQTAFMDQAAALGVAAVDVEEEAVYAGYERDNVALDILPHHLAYVLYTSGSTGKPKGVMLTHGGLVNRLRWMAEAYGMDEREVVLQKTTYTFDVSVWELFLPLMTGGVLCLAKPGGEKDPDYLCQLINEQGITTLHFVPSMLSGFVHALPENASLGQLKRCICSGEELTLEVKERFFRRVEGVELHNLYGPTEATIDVSSYEVHPADPLIPIGKPVANTRLYIVSEEGGLVPVGIPGELCIGGVQLAKGYLNRPELTAEKFRTLPGLPEERLYFTGDLARWREDGNIEYLGRKDTQIKLRGYRIELGEIESAIQKYDSRIETAVVVSQGAQAETKVLCAYFTARERIETEALKEYLRRELPAYMVPVFYTQLDALPHTSSGKADRKTLSQMEIRVEKERYVHPKTMLEKQMSQLWKEVLHIDKVGLRDDFFQIGGDSLSVIILHQQVKQHVDAEISIANLYRYRTIEALLDYLSHKQNSPARHTASNAGRRELLLQGNEKRAQRLSKRKGINRDE